jgi:hypothetical protein
MNVKRIYSGDKRSNSLNSHFSLTNLFPQFNIIILFGACLFSVYPQKDALFINSKGQVSIGTKNPEADFHTAGDAKIDSNLIIGGSIKGKKLVVENEVRSGGRIFDKTGVVMPVGTILPFAGDSSKIPEGWILCDGRAVKSSDYPDLFEIIGTNYGNGTDGCGNTCQFNVPDLRGVFLRGVDGLRNLDPDKENRISNHSGGNTKNKVGSQEADEYENHDHKAPYPQSPFLTYPNAGLGGGPEQNQKGGPEDYSLSVPATATSGGKETRPVNVYVNFIIKF